MPDCLAQNEAELERRAQELAVAWRRGRACRVLNALSQEAPATSGLLAILIHGLLSRWDPVQGELPLRFRRALIRHAAGWLTDEELAELRERYRRRFGAAPPRPATAGGVTDPEAQQQHRLAEARELCEALARDQPIARRPRPAPPQFLRSRRAAS